MGEWNYLIFNKVLLIANVDVKVFRKYRLIATNVMRSHNCNDLPLQTACITMFIDKIHRMWFASLDKESSLNYYLFISLTMINSAGGGFINLNIAG